MPEKDPTIAVEKDLLAVLRCPIQKEPLSLLKDSDRSRLETAFSQGLLLNPDGKALSGPWNPALINESGTQVYAVRDGFPILLKEESACIPKGLLEKLT